MVPSPARGGNRSSQSHDSLAGPSGLSLLQVLRLGLFQGCLGTMAVVFAGLLNRIMLTELAFPGLLVGGALAFEQLVAPSRLLFGQLSDARPFQGRYRVPYVVTGSIFYCLIAVLSIPLIFFVGEAIATDNSRAFWGGATALCGLFALFGLAVAMATTPYLALVIDRTTEQERPRAVGIIWCMLTVGIIVGAICISITLQGLDGVTDPAVLQPALQRFMIQLAVVVLALTIAACWGMEPRGGSRSGNQNPGEVMTLARTWSLLTSSRQTFVFFGFLVLFALGVFLQEPHPGELWGGCLWSAHFQKHHPERPLGNRHAAGPAPGRFSDHPQAWQDGQFSSGLPTDHPLPGVAASGGVYRPGDAVAGGDGCVWLCRGHCHQRHPLPHAGPDPARGSGHLCRGMGLCPGPVPGPGANSWAGVCWTLVMP